MAVWACSVLAVAVVVLWQWATVTANYGGNWSALFCTGAIQHRPPLVASEHIYVFANSTGYDGQIYHYIAHDPFMRSDLKTFIDDSPLRYRRILVPLLAYGLAWGHSRLIDPAYEFVFFLSLGLGVYWSCRFVQGVGLHPVCGLLFLTMPAIPITMDRLVVDGTLAALTAAFLYYSRSPSWKLFLVLVGATLTRETGFLLVLAYCAHWVWRREFRTAALFLLSAVPAIVWYAYVHAKTIGRHFAVSFVPLSSILRALANPWQYPPGVPFPDAVRLADYLALAGALIGLGLAFLWFVRGPSDPLRINAALFGTMALLLQRPDPWQNVYDFVRSRPWGHRTGIRGC